MNQDLTVERVTGGALQDIWARCSELALMMSYPSFFCTGAWLKVSAKLLLQNESLVIIVVKRKGCLKAVLPLFSKPNSLGGRDLHFLGSDYYPDPLGLICSLADRNDSIDAIKKFLFIQPGWDRLNLKWVLEDELFAWDLPGRPVSVEYFKPLQQDFEGMLKEFKRKNRRYLKTKARKVLEAGGAFVVSGHGDTLSDKEFLEALFTLHRKRAVERGIDSSIRGKRVEMLHHLVCENSNNTRFFGINLNKELVAVLYCYLFGNRLFAYQIAHDPRYGDLGLGTALLYFAIENSCANGVIECNFLQGGEGYKEMWTDESRLLYQAVLYQRNWRASLFDFLTRGKMFLKKILENFRRGV